MKYSILLIFSCVILFTGCADDSHEANTVFIGGQINNPETDFIIISKENETIDTLFLDEKNQFGKDYENLEGGIYTFKHPPESQIMYMEPGDSIIIWLNTMSFDESLNFSGKGAEKSNFLLDMFLKNQRNNDLILTYYKIEPEKFAKITDSIKNHRIEILNDLKESNEFSDDFLKIAQASIDYEYYDLRERYTFLIRKYYKSFAEKIPADFNDYREKIDFNNEELQDYYVYTNFIDDFLRSKSIETCNEKHEDHKKCLNINSFRNIERRIMLIDSLSDIGPLKNEFLDRLSAQAIVMAETESRLDSVINLLEDIAYTNLEGVKDLVNIQKAYLVGKNINKLKLKNTDGTEIAYGNLINAPTVIYGWSIYAPSHHRWQHSVINRLKEKYPEVHFIGGNVDIGEHEEWLRTLETFGYDKNNEYQITRRIATKETYRKYLNKILFVSPQGNVLKGNSQLGSSDFENELLEFLNK